MIFTALLGQGRVQLGGRLIHQSTYYVASMAAFAVMTACYNNIAIGLAFQRDACVLKRTRGTPLPSVVFFGAEVLHALLVALLLVLITVTFGKVAYGAKIPTATSLFQFLVILVVGAASFCALGFQQRRGRPDRQRHDPSASLPVGHLHPDRGQRTAVDQLDCQDLPGQGLRRRDPGGIPGHRISLE